MERQIAYVLLDRPRAVDARLIVQAIRVRYPTLSVEMDSSGENEDDAQVAFIRCEGKRITIANMRFPLPMSDDEGFWNRAAGSWPEAKAVESGHGAHLLIAMIDRGESALQEARWVTAVVGGVLDAVAGCVAVEWASRLVRSAERWRDESRSAMSDYPNYPILLWVDIFPVRAAAGIDVLTVGLSSFIGREIEGEVGKEGPSGTFSNVANLALYLIEHGDVIKDGDTFGGSETERTVARHAMSAHISGVPVLRVAAE